MYREREGGREEGREDVGQSSPCYIRDTVSDVCLPICALPVSVHADSAHSNGRMITLYHIISYYIMSYCIAAWFRMGLADIL